MENIVTSRPSGQERKKQSVKEPKGDNELVWQERQDKIVDTVQRRNYGNLDHSLTLEMIKGFI